MPSASWLFPFLLPAGLLAPGWLLGRALRTPAGPAGAFLGSAAMLMNLVLVLDALHLSLDFAHLAVGLGLICGALVAIIFLRQTRSNVAAPVPREKVSWSRAHWLLVPAGVGLAAIAVRAILEPLSGFDTFFRWDFLAREMVRTGSLQFYPAVTADDFLHYSWCDGIAPLVSTLYLWTYCSLGQVAAWATAPIVVAQAALLLWLVGQLASRHGGAAAGLAAMAVLAINPWALWAMAMGQETGCTALGLLGMFYFFDRARTEPEAHSPVWAGVAAGTGALAREYGLVFIALGFATMAWQRVPRRSWIEFSIAAGAIAAPWYLRNWVRTGNPLWSQSVGGLFPANRVQLEYYDAVRAFGSIVTNPANLLPAATLLALAIVPLALGAAGALARWRERDEKPWWLAIAAVVALWLWSIGQTSGGTAYSIRVLAPTFALGAVFAGLGLRRWAASSRGPVLAVVLFAFAVEAGARSLYFPVSPSIAWWGEPAGSWREFGQAAAKWRANPNWQAIADSADGRKILVSDPSCHTLLVERGAKPVPFFSPEVDFLFGPGAEFSTRVARLRTLGFRFIVMTRGNSVNDLQLQRHPFFVTLLGTPPAGTAPLYFVFDLYAPALEASRTAAVLPNGH